jgi:UDP-N-acetylglucosamine--N-acetylmuramyl-(pentapeptide) pyrophosphoryl-undecaprenol N-acetylglucosamine transferase
LLRLQPGAQIVFASSDREIDRSILDRTSYAVVVQPVKPLPGRRLKGWGAFARAYFASALQARQMVRDLRPAAVLGLGGFAAGPVVCRAVKEGVRAGLLNQDAVPGKANRMLAKRVGAIFTQFSSTAECFPSSVRGKVRQVGCPVRAEFAHADRREAVAHFGLDPARKTLFVNGGSLGAASINEAVACLGGDLDSVAAGWQLLHVVGQARAGHYGPPRGYTAPQHGAIPTVVLDYCTRMELAYAASDLALTRGGAGTVAELTATGTPAVLMPYPYHADQQQRLNGAALCQAGSAVICDDAKDPHANADRLRQILLPILREPARLEQMRHAAAGTRTVDAAEKVARWLAGTEDRGTGRPGTVGP